MMYEAQIVEKPNAALAMWIKALVIVHGSFSLYTAYSYQLHNATDIRWVGLGCSWFFFGIIVPILGLRASEQSDKRRLALFSGIQGFVGFCNLINFLSFASVLVTLMNLCSSDDCQRMFKSRNHSCLVSLSNETYEMSESYCDDNFYNVGTAFFFLLLSWVSCMGAMSARQMNEIKVVSVVSVVHQSVGRFAPMIPPEELDVCHAEEFEVQHAEEFEVQHAEDLEVQHAAD